MYVTLGARTRPEGLVDLLLECHGRIRMFSALARTVGERVDASAEETVEACARCERYFREALPLHVADEEESLVPRLHGRATELDTALVAMAAQHAEHEAMVCALVEALARVRAAPGDVGARALLRECAGRACRDFEAHLALEEEVVFPAVRALLGAMEQAEVVAALRARRAPVTPPGG
jgi:iron-sulfur cluster repair protein YtfE (RIC family)